MSKFFFPEYPSKEYIHSYFKRSVSRDILDAFKLFTSKYDIDVKYRASQMNWYVTCEDRVISDFHDTRQSAILWIMENIKGE